MPEHPHPSFFATVPSEEKYRKLHESLTDAFVLVGLDGSILEFNRAYREMLGYTDEELLKLTYIDLTPSRWHEFEAEIVKDQILPRGYSDVYEKEYIRKNGSVFPVELRAFLMRDDQGNPISIWGIARDITERKRAEEQLRQTKEELEKFFLLALDLLCIADTDGRFLRLNRSWEKTLGYSLEELMQGKFLDFVHPDDLQPTLQALQTLSDQQPLLHFINRYKCKDGSFRWIEWNSYPSGNLIYAAARDITEQRRTEEALRNTQKLESLGVLAGGIAHDFNNLLGGIFGFIDLARLNCREKDLAQVEENLGQAMAVFNRARDLTRQLLTFSKGGKPIKRVCSIAPLIRKAAEFVLTGSNVQLEFTPAANLSLCEIDENQFEQVIDNVVLNARQAMPMGGRVLIHAENLNPATTLPPNLAKRPYIHIQITDSGVGIPPAYLDRIFDPFFTTKQQGSGLGLATAYSIMRNHDGLITAESESGKGSVFHLFLPQTDQAQILTTASEAFRPSCSAHVLVMDDEDFIRSTATQLLECIGCRVTAVSAGEEAIAVYGERLAAADRFDIAILDLTVPGGKGGKETLAGLLAIDPSVLAVATSGYSDDPIMASPEKFGFKDRLIKPYTGEDLFLLVQTLHPDSKKTAN